MTSIGDVYEGVVALNNVTTGERIRAGVLVAYSEDRVTYTARSVDGTISETITTARGACDFFTAMMEVVARVGRVDRDTEPARRHRSR